jgi:hypothetical protein
VIQPPGADAPAQVDTGPFDDGLGPNDLGDRA